MTNQHHNGQSGQRSVGSTPPSRSLPTAIPCTDAETVRVVDLLPTDLIHTPPDNEIDMEAVEDLRRSIAEHGQFVEIIVYPHPDRPGHYLCADGNHRLAAKRLLGETIRARILEKAPTEAELITISAYLVASLPHEVQRAILPQVLGKKREAVQRIVQGASGTTKPKGDKPLKLVCGDVAATVKGDKVAALRAFVAKVTEALKKLERDNLPPEFLRGLMQ